MTIYQKLKVPFKPTYLYIKQHAVTGKLYFGKTVSKYVKKYQGSGKLWTRHIRKHGKEHIITLWYCLFYEEASIKQFALSCSEQWNIVESDQWLNLRPEDGLSGGNMKGVNKGVPKSLMHKHNLSLAGKGKHNHKHTKETCLKISKSKAGKPFSSDHKENVSKGLIGNSRRKNTGKYNFFTPNGVFNSSHEAGIANNISNVTIVNRCIKQQDSIIRFNSALKIHKDFIGKTWKEAGFYHELR